MSELQDAAASVRAETWAEHFDLVPGQRCVCHKVIYASLADAYEAAKRFENQTPYVGRWCKQIHLTTIKRHFEQEASHD